MACTFSLSAVVVLLCAASLTVVKSQQPEAIIKEWRRYYSEVFEGYAILEEVQVLSRMTFMHSEIELLKAYNGSATGRMINNFYFVYGALADTDLDHCSVQHLDEVKIQLFRRFQDPSEGALKTLLPMVHRNLVEVCGDAYVGVDQVLDGAIKDPIRTHLRNLKWTYENYRRGEVSRKKLQRDVFMQIKIDGPRFTEQEIIDAWDDGPCWKLYSTMDKLGIHSFHEFVKLDAYLGPAAANKCRPPLESWVRTIHACDQLELMIADLAKKDVNPELNSSSAPLKFRPQRKRDRLAKAVSKAPRHLMQRVHIRSSS